jgi:hypothetical protein
MRKYLGLLVLGFSLTANANANGLDLCKWLPFLCKIDPPTPKPTTTVPMPEPSAIPETVICMAGLGYMVYRQRKADQNKKAKSA